MEENIVVSICCITYNQEKYIADAIESFLMQKTNFKFEIIIHDDASTDNTANIVREYAKMYPELIRPILQTENQYSKGLKMFKAYVYPSVKGKYVALNEGDDYWLDPNKLQKQVDYMEAHSECSLCVHATKNITADNKPLHHHVRPHVGNKIFDANEVILGGGGLFATNSILFPTKYTLTIPDFVENAPVGDYPLVIYLALMGSVYYIDEFMSAYRTGVAGSWSSETIGEDNMAKVKPLLKKLENMLLEIDAYTDYKFTAAIQQRININEGNLLLSLYLIEPLKNDEKYRCFYQSLTRMQILKLHLGAYNPYLYKSWRNLRKQLTRCQL